MLTERQAVFPTTLNLPAELGGELQKTVAFIATQQTSDGAIPWFCNHKLDPWDHVEAAMGLTTGGAFAAAERAYMWLAEAQLADGSWYAEYFQEAPSTLRETNFVAYIATGVWHHYSASGDKAFLHTMMPAVTRAIDWVISLQQPEGDIAWAADAAGRPAADALVTGCSSILRSLECACRAAAALKQSVPAWHSAGRALYQALKYKPYRFDRTWPSKQRFAMDWYYPVLAGIYTRNEARARLSERWTQFVHTEPGCHCVQDEPWVTMAETSELVIASVAAGEHAKALALFTPLSRWTTGEGAYWTGYAYKDAAIWPEETTSWTAAAVLLAADALYQLTPAHSLFTKPSLFR